MIVSALLGAGGRPALGDDVGRALARDAIGPRRIAEHIQAVRQHRTEGGEAAVGPAPIETPGGEIGDEQRRRRRAPGRRRSRPAAARSPAYIPARPSGRRLRARPSPAERRRSIRRAHASEPAVGGKAEIGIVGEPVGGREVARIAVPGAAAQDPVLAGDVRGRLALIGRIEIARPFPDIADEIEDALLAGALPETNRPARSWHSRRCRRCRSRRRCRDWRASHRRARRPRESARRRCRAPRAHIPARSAARRPKWAQNAAASSKLTPTTGRSSRPRNGMPAIEGGAMPGRVDEALVLGVGDLGPVDGEGAGRRSPGAGARCRCRCRCRRRTGRRESRSADCRGSGRRRPRPAVPRGDDDQSGEHPRNRHDFSLSPSNRNTRSDAMRTPTV